MGTYTTNYNLYMPSDGEQGWGDLVNGNFVTIDTTMKSLSNRIAAVENEVDGALSCTSVTTSETITAHGIINAMSGIMVTSGIAGKIIVSTYTDDTLSLLLANVSASGASTTGSNTSPYPATLTLNLPAGTFTYHNTSFIDFVIPDNTANDTCTLSMRHTSVGSTLATGLKIVDSDGTTVLNTTINVTHDGATTTFTRNLTKSYAVTFSRSEGAKLGGYTVSASASNTKYYA